MAWFQAARNSSQNITPLTRLVCSHHRSSNNVKRWNVFLANGTIAGSGICELSNKFSTLQSYQKRRGIFGTPGIELKNLSFMQSPCRLFSKEVEKVVKEEKKENEIYKKIREAGMTYAPVERRNRQDHYRRHMAAKYEVERRLYKAIARDEHLPNELRDQARLKLSQYPKNTSFIRIRNRCIITGRPRAVYRRFKISRLVLRELARAGELPGVTKASW